MILHPNIAIDNGWISFPADLPIDSNQIQPNGIDVRFNYVTQIPTHKPYKLFKDKKTHIEYVNVKQHISSEEPTIYRMERGIPYNVTCLEWVDIPANVSAQVIIRSSLNMGGVWGASTLYDSGFSNYVGLILYPFVDFEVEYGSRIAQIVFYDAQSHHLYNGRNQAKNENK